jgi:hypothetical protein
MKRIVCFIVLLAIFALILPKSNLHSQSGNYCCDYPTKGMLDCCCAYQEGYDVSWCDNGCSGGVVVWMNCVYYPVV